MKKKILFLTIFLFLLASVNAAVLSLSWFYPDYSMFPIASQSAIETTITCTNGPCENIEAVLQYCKGSGCSDYADIPEYGSLPEEDLMLDNGNPLTKNIALLEGSEILRWNYDVIADPFPYGENYSFRVIAESSNAETETLEEMTVYINSPPEVTLIEPLEQIEIKENDKIDVIWNAVDSDSEDILFEVYLTAYENCGSEENLASAVLSHEVTLISTISGPPNIYSTIPTIPNMGPVSNYVCIFVRANDNMAISYSEPQRLYYSAESPSPCSDLLLTLTAPEEGLTIFEKEIFTFQVRVYSSSICTTNLTFQYDQGKGLDVFYRIPDTVYTPENQSLVSNDRTLRNIYLEGSAGGAPEDELPEIFFDSIYFATAIPSAVIDCNAKGDYVLRAFSDDPAEGPVSSENTVTIHCLENTDPVASFISPAVASFVYGSSYRVEWDAFDTEGAILSFDLSWSGPTSGSVENLNETYYTVTDLVPGDYTFLLEVSDGVNAVVQIESPVLSVIESSTTIFVTEFSVFPQSFYADSSVEFEVVLRNDSPNTVDFEVLFFNADFVPNSFIEKAENIQPYSSTTVSFQKTLSDSDNIEPGDHQLFVFVEEYFAGTETKTGNEITSFVNFTILAEEGSTSASEINLFSLILVGILVLSLLRAKTK